MKARVHPQDTGKHVPYMDRNWPRGTVAQAKRTQLLPGSGYIRITRARRGRDAS